jgi:hypothetical protein
MSMEMKATPVNELKSKLTLSIGSRNPLQIRKKNLEVVICYVRGFADPKQDVLLFSDNPDSMAMRILEIKNIHAIVPLMWE